MTRPAASSQKITLTAAYHRVRSRWPLTPQQRQDCIDRLSEIVSAGSDASPAEIVMAAEGLLRAWRQNEAADRQAAELGATSKRAVIRLPRRSDPPPVAND